MLTFTHVVVVARIARGLLAGRDGEDVVAEARAAPVADGAFVMRSLVVTVVLSCVAVGFARAAGEGNSGVGPTGAFHHIRTPVDL